MKALASFAVRIFADEILLVHARGELDDFGRDFEEILLEPAEQRHRPFGQAGVLDHQPLVLDQREAGLGSDFRRAGADHVLTLLVIDDDMAGAQLHRVIIRHCRW